MFHSKVEVSVQIVSKHLEIWKVDSSNQRNSNTDAENDVETTLYYV